MVALKHFFLFGPVLASLVGAAPFDNTNSDNVKRDVDLTTAEPLYTRSEMLSILSSALESHELSRRSGLEGRALKRKPGGILRPPSPPKRPAAPVNQGGFRPPAKKPAKKPSLNLAPKPHPGLKPPSPPKKPLPPIGGASKWSVSDDGKKKGGIFSKIKNIFGKKKGGK